MKKTKSGQNHFWYYEAMAIIPTYIKNRWGPVSRLTPSTQIYAKTFLQKKLILQKIPNF